MMCFSSNLEFVHVVLVVVVIVACVELEKRLALAVLDDPYITTSSRYVVSLPSLAVPMGMIVREFELLLELKGSPKGHAPWRMTVVELLASVMACFILLLYTHCREL
ncbi:hypothetical protein K435DRAFT_396369 [Dendrothele bispora CBS 962.96]|uniref:Uncharacterized protein n=1 Tax=Dendrothele bispora (strain CBS 962.96) TaxID=1314807 RepID=A0A4S8MFY7_DENBC|nr:hypothetical protein K435DRAFT_396369 [Dendrothele bispora CBS 962.96]